MEGLDQNESADGLVIIPKTVGSNIEHILGKLGVRSRAQAYSGRSEPRRSARLNSGQRDAPRLD